MSLRAFCVSSSILRRLSLFLRYLRNSPGPPLSIAPAFNHTVASSWHAAFAPKLKNCTQMHLIAPDQQCALSRILQVCGLARVLLASDRWMHTTLFSASRFDNKWNHSKITETRARVKGTATMHAAYRAVLTVYVRACFVLITENVWKVRCFCDCHLSAYEMHRMY